MERQTKAQEPNRLARFIRVARAGQRVSIFGESRTFPIFVRYWSSFGVGLPTRVSAVINHYFHSSQQAATVSVDPRYFGVFNTLNPFVVFCSLLSPLSWFFYIILFWACTDWKVKSERLKELRGLNKAFAIMDPEVRYTLFVSRSMSLFNFCVAKVTVYAKGMYSPRVPGVPGVQKHSSRTHTTCN